MPNKIIDLRPLCPPVLDQGNLATDSASALCSALEMIEIKAGRPNVRLSRLFLYYNQRIIERNASISSPPSGDLRGGAQADLDNGAKIESGIKSLTEQGYCTEESWPYNTSKFAVRPSDACYMEALIHRIASSQKLDNLDQMRASLANGFPFVFSMTIYESFQSPSVEKTGIVTMPSSGEQYFGSMAVLAVGYDDFKKTLIVRNSFGPAWGNMGYFTLPYDYASAKDMATDFWTLRSE
jgi:C1A family cysteine protease